MYRMTFPIIITGKQGCGKMTNSKALAELFNRKKIIDGYVPGTLLPNNAIAFTNCDVKGKGVILFDTAIKVLKQFQGRK